MADTLNREAVAALVKEVIPHFSGAEILLRIDPGARRVSIGDPKDVGKVQPSCLVRIDPSNEDDFKTELEAALAAQGRSNLAVTIGPPQ